MSVSSRLREFFNRVDQRFNAAWGTDIVEKVKELEARSKILIASPKQNMSALSVRLYDLTNRIYILPEDRCYRQGESVECSPRLRDVKPNSEWLENLLREVIELEARDAILTSLGDGETTIEEIREIESLSRHGRKA